MLQASPTTSRPLWQRFVGLHTWQTLRAATWLEWQEQGNWTNPWLFLLYLVLRPLTAALVLVFMYWIISGFQARGGIFGFLIVGSASWSFVEQILSGIPRVVLEDREEYAMLKYIYIAPSAFIAFLVGRSMPRLLAACISFVITLAFGITVLGVPIEVQRVNYVLLLLALLIGVVGIAAQGIAVAGLTLMPDAMAGALYLLAGAIFPITLLPGWAEKLALCMPLSYWLELMRRALLGDAIGAAFPIATTPALVGLLVLTTILTTLACIGVFRFGEHVARERGQIDRATGD